MRQSRAEAISPRRVIVLRLGRRTRCRRDESTEWTTLPQGTYGSSASAAEFVRDDLFTGSGTLTVGSAAPNTDVMLLIW